MYYSKRKESQGFGDESRSPTTGMTMCLWWRKRWCKYSEKLCHRGLKTLAEKWSVVFFRWQYQRVSAQPAILSDLHCSVEHLYHVLHDPVSSSPFVDVGYLAVDIKRLNVMANRLYVMKPSFIADWILAFFVLFVKKKNHNKLSILLTVKKYH